MLRLDVSKEASERVTQQRNKHDLAQKYMPNLVSQALMITEICVDNPDGQARLIPSRKYIFFRP